MYKHKTASRRDTTKLLARFVASLKNATWCLYFFLRS